MCLRAHQRASQPTSQAQRALRTVREVVEQVVLKRRRRAQRLRSLPREIAHVDTLALPLPVEGNEVGRAHHHAHAARVHRQHHFRVVAPWRAGARALVNASREGAGGGLGTPRGAARTPFLEHPRPVEAHVGRGLLHVRLRVVAVEHHHLGHLGQARALVEDPADVKHVVEEKHGVGPPVQQLAERHRARVGHGPGAVRQARQQEPEAAVGAGAVWAPRGGDGGGGGGGGGGRGGGPQGAAGAGDLGRRLVAGPGPARAAGRRGLRHAGPGTRRSGHCRWLVQLRRGAVGAAAVELLLWVARA